MELLKTMRNRRIAMTARLRSDSGSALIELAVVLSVLVTIMVGAAEFAMLGYDSIEVSDAARAGAGYAAQSTGSASDTSGIKSVAGKAAADVSGMTTTPTVEYSCSSTPSTLTTTAPTSCSSSDTVLTYIEVATTATINMPVHLPGFSSYTVNGQAIMRVQ